MIYMQYLLWGDEKQLCEEEFLTPEPVKNEVSRNVFGFLGWYRVKDKSNAEEGESLLHDNTIDRSYGAVSPTEC